MVSDTTTTLAARFPRWLVLLLSLLSLAVLFGPGLVEHMQNAANPYAFNNDARMQIFPLLRYWDGELLQDDYVADYFLGVMLPHGYSLFYGALAQVFDPRNVSIVLPYILLALTTAMVAAAAHKVSGATAAWCAAAFCLAADMYLGGMVGGLPRAFGKPVMAMVVLGLVYGNTALLIAATLIGAAFYFTAGAVAGLCLATYLLLFPPSWRSDGGAWSWPRRLVLVGITGVLAIVIVSPTLIEARAYGPSLTVDQADAYPEAGIGGRYKTHPMPPAFGLPRLENLTAAAAVTMRAFRAREAFRSGDPLGGEDLYGFAEANLVAITVIVMSLTAVGTLMSLGNPAVRRLLIVPAVGLLLLFLAYALSPYLYFPNRPIGLTFPIVAGILFPTALIAILRRVYGGRLRRLLVPPTVIALSLVVVFLLGGRNTVVSLDQYDSADGPVYDHVAELPTDAMIAGSPGDLMDNMSYLTGRSMLVGFEVHQAFHKNYVEEMRRRMMAVIDALYADNTDPLIALHDAWGVTHFIVDKRFYDRDDPKYFKPFDEAIAAAESSLNGTPAVLRQDAYTTVFADGDIVVVDVAALVADQTSND